MGWLLNPLICQEIKHFTSMLSKKGDVSERKAEAETPLCSTAATTEEKPHAQCTESK